MNKFFKRLALLLAVLMIVSMMPVQLFAADNGTVTIINTVVEAGTEADLISAINGSENGATIKLTGNIELTAKLVIPKNKQFTLNLGEYNITQTADGVNAINLSSGDKVTVIGTGTITGNNNGVYVPSGAELTVDGATIVATVYNGISNEGTVTLKSGELTGGTDGEFYFNGIYTKGTTTVDGGTVKGIYVDGGSVTVNGGTIAKNSDGDSFPADGGTLVITNGEIEGWMSPALTTVISGGTFSDSVFANEVTGGTFNGSLTMNGETPSITGATINSKFTWWSSTVPTVSNVMFGENAKITTNSTGKNTGDYQINATRDGIEEKTYRNVSISSEEGGSHTVTVNANGTNIATKTETNPWSNAKAVDGDTYKVTIVSATAADGYKFDGWYLNGVKTEPVDGVISFTVNGDMTLVAKFVSLELDTKAKEFFKDYETATEFTVFTEDEMELLAYAVSNLGYTFDGKTVKLGASLDFSGKTYRVIGNATYAFKGTFDGGNNSISNITKTTEDKFVGLFGKLSGATVKNLTLKDSTFDNGGTGYAGGIVAEAEVGTTIADCTVSGVTTNAWFSGAVVGHTYGGVTVKNVVATGCAASGSKGGVIAGYSDSITISNVEVSDVKDGAALIGHANAGANVIENVTVNAPDAALISLTYSESEGTIKFTGENTSIVAKSVLGEAKAESKTVTVEAGKFTTDGTTSLDVSDYLASGKTQNEDGTIGDAPTYVATVNGVGYETLAEAIAAATPDANGVITYEIYGKAEISGNDQWISFVNATGVTSVKFVGMTEDAEIIITSSQSILGVQGTDVDVSFENLTLSHPNGEWVKDLANATNYFACMVRNSGHTVTYTNCTFPNGACNNQFGKTVFNDCKFTSTTGWSLWNTSTGTSELNNCSFTGKRGIKLYAEGDTSVAGSVTVKDTTFALNDAEKAAIEITKPGSVTLDNISVSGTTAGTIKKNLTDGYESVEKVTVTATGTGISGTFEGTTESGVAKEEFNISGGTFNSKVSSDYLADGFEVKKNEDGTYGVSAKTYVATIGTVGYETLDAAIAAANDGEVIVVNAGEYKLNGSLTYAGKAFTIKAADGEKVSFDMSAGVALHGAKITFEGVTFDYKTNGNYIGLQHTDTLVYNNCTINGMVFLYATNETFNSCVFNQTSADAYNVWTYGAKNVEFNGCEFYCVGKSVLLYSETKDHSTNLTVADTTFTASAPVAGKAAIEIDTSLMSGANVTVDKATADKTTGFATGSNSGNSLWNDKKQTAAENKNTTVIVDGETVFEPAFIDFDTFIKKLIASGYNFDGALAGGGKLTVKWSPVSGCYDTREGHTCTVNGVTATGNTPNRVNSGLAQFHLLDGVQDVSIKNVNFVYVSGDFTVCANSDWKGTGTKDTVKTAQIFLLNSGNTIIEGCSFDNAVFTGWQNTGKTEIKNSSFKNIYNSYAIKDLGGSDVSVTDCSFENCGGGVMLDSNGARTASASVSITGNTFTDVDVAGTAADGKVGTRAILQIASKGNYEDTNFDFSGNTADNCGPVIRQLNESAIDNIAGHKDTLTELVGEGKASGYATTDTVKYIVEVNGKKYASLDAAIAVANSGDTITLIADVTVSATITVAGKELVLDLNGKSITNSAAAISVAADAKLTVKDSAGNGKIAATGNYADAIENKGTLIIESGTFEGAYGAIRALGGSTTTINGGTFSSSTGRYGMYYWANGTALTVTVNGGTFNHSVSTAMEKGLVTLKVNGGTFANDLSDYCPEGFGTVLENGKYVYDSIVVPAGYVEDENGNVTIFDEDGLFWFAKQVNRGNNFAGKTVKLANDITLTKDWTPAGTFNGTFDGDGHTISGVKASSYSGYGLGFFKTIISATIKNVTFKNAEINGHNGTNVVGIVSGYAYGKPLFENVHVVDSKVVGFGKVGGLLGMNDDGQTTTVKNCSVTGTTISGTYNVAGFCGLIIGSCNISGSYLSGITTELKEDSYNFPGGFVDLDTTIACDGSAASCPGNGTVIKGKYIVDNSCYWSAWSDLYNHYGNSSHDCALTGETLKLANSEVVHDAPVKIGDVLYSDLQAAFDAAKTGDTVTLLSDITLTEQVNITKALNGLTLDGNGHTIICATTENVFASGGSALYFGNDNDKLYCTGIKIKDLTMTGTARFAIFLCGGTTTEFTNVNISGNYYIAINLYGTHGATMTNCNISNSTTGTDKYISAIWSNVASANPLKLVNTKVSTIAINEYTTANTLAPKIYVMNGSEVGEIHTFDDGSVSMNKKLCVSTESTGTYTVKEYDSLNSEWVDIRVAKVGDTYYSTLAGAIAAAKSGATVTLLDYVKENVTISKKLTLDLNGFTINGGIEKGKAALKVDNCSVTIKDSSEKQTGTIMREDTAENSGVSSYYVIDIQGKYGFLKFESGNVKNNSGIVGVKGASLVRLGDDSNMNANPTLTITGGTFTQDNFIAIKVDHGTLHFLGGTINSANSYAIENWCNANIKGGTINGTVASWTYSGGTNSKLNITDGTINGDVYSVNYGSADGRVAKVIITGGEITGKLDTRNYDPKTGSLTSIDDAAKATIEVTGGTFDIDPSKYVTEDAKVNNNDGKFGVERVALCKIGDTEYLTMAEALKAVKTGDTIVLLHNYTTDSEQRSGAKSYTIDLNGYTWTFTKLGTEESGPAPAFWTNNDGYTLTIKNGKVVSADIVGFIDYNNAGLVFDGVEITANGRSGIETNGNNTNDTVKLVNSTLNVPNGYGIYFPSSGELIIENSEITAKTMGVQVCSGTLSITGADTKITVTGDAVKKTENDGAIEDGAAISIVNRNGYKGLEKVEIKNGKFTSKDGNNAIKAYDWANKTETDFTAGEKVSVSGGTFSSAVDEDLCAEGYIPTKNADGTYGVKEGKYVAQIGDVKYETLQAAIAAVKSDETITLLDDIDLGTDKLSTYNVKSTVKNVTIDLGGHTLTSAGQYTVYLRVNDWTIQNGTITNTNASTTYGALAVIGGYNSTTLKNVTIESKTNGVYFAMASNKNGLEVSITVEDGTKISGNYGVYMKGQPKPYGNTRDGQEILNVNGGEITGKIAAIAVFGAAKGNTKAGVIVNINGGKVYSEGYAIAGNGSTLLENTTININGGSVISTKDTAIYHPQAGTVNVTGGTVSGVTGGIQMCAGTLNVTGGTITATGNGDISGKTGDGSIPDGAAVSIVNRGYPAGAPTAAISGGVLTSAENVDAVQAYEWSSDAKAEWSNPNASVSGGTFSSAVKEDLCADGYIPTQNDDGTYGVKEGKYVAQIGDVKYETLAEAVAAVAANGEEVTIKLLSDITAGGIDVVAGQNIVFDFDGHTYTLDGSMVGSTGTKTNGFRFLKGSTVVLKNGTLANGNESPAKAMINSYATLKLIDFSVDARTTAVAETGSAYGYAALYISNGVTTVTGNGNYTTSDDNFVILVASVEGYTDGASLVFDKNYTGTVSGRVSTGNKQNATVEIKNGKFDLKTIDVEGTDTTVTISGGKFKNIEIAGKYLDSQNMFATEADADGYYDVKGHPITSTGLTLSKDISIRIVVGSEYKDGKIKVTYETYDSTTKSMVTKELILDKYEYAWDDEGKPKYQFRISNITPQMADVVFTLQYLDSDDNKIGSAKQISIVKYCGEVAKTSAFEAYKAKIGQLLNYCATAMEFRAVSHKDDVYNGLSWAQRAEALKAKISEFGYTVADFDFGEIAKKYVNQRVESIVTGYGVEFAEEIKLYFFVDIKNYKEGYTYGYGDNAGYLIPVPDYEVDEETGEKVLIGYRFYFSIDMESYCERKEVAVYDANGGRVQRIGISLEWALEKLYNNETNSQELRQLCKAAYQYFIVFAE